ncbi:MAG TPA: FAD/NAD(P)-binding oxidoreductase [Accumulibacter sp.]|nr:FAD/NAD(P)-binding oxidoreductase [Accumulibacter sp.]HMW18183.1 FAD/NAD(P)-binding oxidoreductase [Accumulibacter sp.]HMY06721.1 FAD/NAD(P)-binding oxidoreductase [Accumulibacter sp.]HND80382.1 FAD/NAD(P)-binding oxidoreductase [Accumulibacter sp.]HNE13670.1 FAD/NAD(P)-binding oxidoreductase [Accumulibacter sp.]
MFNRRQFIGTLGAGSLAAMVPLKAVAATPRVIIVGGGMAGVTAAKYLRLWSGKTIDVTLVTPTTNYVSNIMSNLVVTGQMAYSSLQFTYATLTSTYGVRVVTGTVTGVSGYGANATGTVSLSNGTKLTSERLILAPGISVDEVPLTGTVTGQTLPVLHAWQAGVQTTALQTLLKNIPNGGRFVLTIPPKPYRCPPGPYERACVIADYLKRNKPGAKIHVLDANDDITAEPDNFRAAFKNYNSAGVLEYWPSTSVVSVNSTATAGKDQTVTINTGTQIQNTIGINAPGQKTLFGNVMNIIPPHRAPKIVFDTGVVPTGAKFAPVDVRTFESMVAGHQGIYVIGDSSDTSLPKAGHVANQEAKICANAIINTFKGLPIEPSPTANSACFSPINSTQASWLTAVYQYKEVAADGLTPLAANKRFVIWDDALSGSAKYAKATEAASPSTKNFSNMGTWYKVLMNETFS